VTENSASEILATLPAHMSEAITPWVQKTPDHPALVESSGSWTYAEFAAVIAKTQEWLSGSGIRPGDRVMIVGENCRAFAALLFAIAGIDAWPVPVNSQLSEREIDGIREHSGARRIVYAGTSSHTSTHAKRDEAVADGPPELGPAALGRSHEDVTPEAVDPNIASRVASLIYTSGTTGKPKGVMLTHRNLLFTAAVAAKIRSLMPEDRLYCVLPLSHVVGLSIILLGTLMSGATVYLAGRFDPMSARVALDREGITIMLGVPAMFGQFLRYARMKKTESLHFPALRIISCSGAPLDASTKSAVEKLFGLTLHHGYGITECAPNIAQTRVESPRADTSVGPALPGVEIKIMGNQGQPVSDGEVGEVWIRGPNIMKGYYHAPEETAAAVNVEGWFNSRDLGRTVDGNLFLVGRTKDLIIRSGFNVYPAEVEGVLNSHPAVAQSAVLGRSVSGDEEVVAFVQLMPETSATPRELQEYAAKRLANYKWPSRIVILEAMPSTPTGKIIKGELAKLLADEASLQTLTTAPRSS
jgi:long-chain acyl-CoA synthetase